MSIIKGIYLRASFCALLGALVALGPAAADGQIKRRKAAADGLPVGPVIATTLTDSFPDPDNDGRAAAGAEITYTATVTNTGDTTATGVNFANPLDANATYVPNSVFIQSNLNAYVLRCAFTTAGGGTVNCNNPSTAYDQLVGGNLRVFGGQGTRLNLDAANASYNAGAGIFTFDATVQNLLPQALGTIDDVTVEADGVRLLVHGAAVIAGTGTIAAANADGTQTYTASNQPYFQYNQKIGPNQTSAAKTLQLSVPPTVSSFTVDFLVAAVPATRIVINEVLSNPGGTITDANGEWFELYNNGLFPVNLQNFYIGDTSGSGDRPIHKITADLTIAPGGYVTMGNTTNTTNNGGVPIDYAYGSALALANSLDAVRFLSPYSIPSDPTVPGSGYFIELDRVNYSMAATSAQNGISRELKNPNLENVNVDGSNWGDAAVTAVYGPGGRGTPKAQNSAFTPFAPLSGAAPAVSRTANLAGETVTASLGAIAPGESVTITYRVTVPNPIPAGTTQLSTQGTVTGGNFPNATTDDPLTPAAGDATVTPLAVPSAAGVTVSGTVTDAAGRVVAGAVVTLDAGAVTRTARTNTFGFYAFDDVPAGTTALVTVAHRRHQFAPQIVAIGDSVASLDFTALGASY